MTPLTPSDELRTDFSPVFGFGDLDHPSDTLPAPDAPTTMDISVPTPQPDDLKTTNTETGNISLHDEPTDAVAIGVPDHFEGMPPLDPPSDSPRQQVSVKDNNLIQNIPALGSGTLKRPSVFPQAKMKNAHLRTFSPPGRVLQGAAARTMSPPRRPRRGYHPSEASLQ